MTSVISSDVAVVPERVLRQRANALADRLELGACALANFASGLTDAAWQARVPHDERTVGVIVHHVASVYPLEIQPALTLAGGKPVVGVTAADVNAMNAEHAEEHSAAAAAAIRALSDEELDRAAPVSLHAEAPVTCQFMLEDHAVRHSYHHLDRLRAALRR